MTDKGIHIGLDRLVVVRTAFLAVGIVVGVFSGNVCNNAPVHLALEPGIVFLDVLVGDRGRCGIFDADNLY
jgi:hypothetical protein